MKKSISALLSLVLCLSMAACGNSESASGGDENHTCVGAKWVTAAQPSCTATGIEEHICACGEVVATRTIPLLAHTYSDGICTACGSVDPNSFPESFGLEYVDIGGGNLRVVGIGSCTDSVVIIPEYEGSFRVTEIAKKAFINNRKITAVVIPDSVSIIGEEAFKNCTKITSVIIGNGVESISSNAFNACAELTSVQLGSAVKTIGQSAFSNCTSLSAITIPKSVTKIEYSAFSNCDSLLAVNIPGNIGLVLDSRVFFSCDSLRTVVIGSGIKKIPNETFANCTGLTDVTLPDSLREIAYAAFRSCRSLKNITLPANLANIGSEAFSSCSALTQIVIPEQVTVLDSGAFSSCDNLKKVIINATTALEFKYQFEYCDSLEEISIPANLAGQYADGWQSMSHVMELPGMPSGPVSAGLAFVSNGDGTCYVSGRGNCTDTQIVIPTVSPDGDIVIAIGDEAFVGYCYDITSIIVPDTVTKLGAHAFGGCLNLQTLDLPAGITDGYAYMLSENTRLTKLIVRCETFLPWPLDVIIRPEQPFIDAVTIYVPAALVEQYKTASGWSQFAERIQPIAK